MLNFVPLREWSYQKYLYISKTCQKLPQGLPLRMWGCPRGYPWDSPKRPQAAAGTAPGGVLARGDVVCDITNTNRGIGSLRNEDEINILP